MDRFPSFLKDQPVPKAQKLLDAARHYPCANCGKNDGTIVAAHCNELALGRGFAHKTPNYLVAYLCFDCHDAVDGRAHLHLTKEERRAMWNRAYVVTASWWWRDGLVKVA